MTRPSLTDRQILAQIPAARRRGKRARLHMPHAKEARYDRATRMLHIRLTNGASLILPVDLVPTLRKVRDKDLGEVAVGPSGVGLR